MDNHWIFGYGSLIWRPGFEYEESAIAKLQGGHRTFCVRSIRYRGTPKHPGLVFGLDAGGTCTGMVFRVKSVLYPEIRAYLRERELCTNVYKEAFKTVDLQDGTKRRVKALTYVVDCNHRLYVRSLPYDLIAHILRTKSGRSGPNIDYFLNTLTHLRQLEIFDPYMERLANIMGEAKFRKFG